jgi:hypothetical protein
VTKALQITDDTTTINLVQSTSDWHLQEKQSYQFSSEHLIGSDPVAAKTIVESYRLAAGFVDGMDDLASKANALMGLLRQAALHQEHPRRYAPVYIKEQGRTETEARYAEVLRPIGFGIASPVVKPVDLIHWLVDVGVSLEREHPWRPAKPKTLPTPTTVIETGGSSDRTFAPVSAGRNFGDSRILKNYDDSAGVYSANLTGTEPFALWPDPAGVDDVVYIGKAYNRVHSFYVSTAGVYTATVVLEVWTGSWTAMTYGTDYLLLAENYEPTGPDDLFKAEGMWTIGFKGRNDFASVLIDGDTTLWFRVRLSAFTSMTTNPIVGTSPLSYFHTWQNFILVDSDNLPGNHFVRSLFRIFHPNGASGDDPVFGYTSRILFGARTFPNGYGGEDEFAFSISPSSTLGVSGWSSAVGTDATDSEDHRAVSNRKISVDFSTDSSMVPRVTLIGTDKLQYYAGKFEVFLHTRQIGGAAGDISIKARISIGSDDDSAPKRDTVEASPQVPDPTQPGWEYLSLGEIELPFGESNYGENLEIDLIIQIMAERNTGSATLDFANIDFLPVDEWSGVLDDPLSNTDFGSSALRGNSAIDFDGGILDRRAQKYIKNSNGELVSAENWNYEGSLPRLDSGKQVGIVFVPLSFDTGWGLDDNLILFPGMALGVQLFTHEGYVWMRGDS